MKLLITGGAGFIGSNICYILLTNKIIPVTEIVVIDNLSLGKKEFISDLIGPKFHFYKYDLLDFNKTLSVFKKYKFDIVFHMAANSDISYGSKYTNWDLKQGTLATYNVLECMRRTGVKKIVFASTSAIYGETTVFPIQEDYGPLLPISFYGASKLACEGLISAFCSNYGFQAWIYRFANIVGKNGTHGAVVDFIKKLRKTPKILEVLGDGRQAKPYLYVQDCVDGMIFGFIRAKKQVNYFNLTCTGATTVSEIAGMVMQSMKLKDAKIKYTGGDRGWVGDVPQVRLSPEKLTKLGWKAKYTSDQAVQKSINNLIKQI